MRALGVPVLELKADHHGPNAADASYDDGGFLHKKMPICIGARVMLTENLRVDRGLVNGTIGTVQCARHRMACEYRDALELRNDGVIPTPGVPFEESDAARGCPRHLPARQRVLGMGCDGRHPEHSSCRSVTTNMVINHNKRGLELGKLLGIPFIYSAREGYME